MRITTATDVRLNLDKFADRSLAGPWIFLVGLKAWRMTDHALAHLRKAPCPVCEGKPLPRKGYCLGCDRCGLDGCVAFPGLGVDEAPNYDYGATGTVYAGAVEGLAGGQAGGRVGKRKGRGARRVG